MNKKLLAAAIAGVLAAPLAQAQTANVTLYGRLNLSTQVILNAKQDNGVKQNQYQVGSNSSRLGVRGTEALGGGLNAIFQFEQRFDASNSSNVTSSGDTYAGLQGGQLSLSLGLFHGVAAGLGPLSDYLVANGCKDIRASFIDYGQGVRLQAEAAAAAAEEAARAEKAAARAAEADGTAEPSPAAG